MIYVIIHIIDHLPAPDKFISDRWIQYITCNLTKGHDESLNACQLLLKIGLLIEHPNQANYPHKGFQINPELHAVLKKALPIFEQDIYQHYKNFAHSLNDAASPATSRSSSQEQISSAPPQQSVTIPATPVMAPISISTPPSPHPVTVLYPNIRLIPSLSMHLPPSPLPA